MSGIAIAALVLGAIAVLCLVTALGQLWAIGGQIEDPVGPPNATRPAPAQPALVPVNFRSLIGAEALLWKSWDQWHVLVARLDELERRLGGTPQTQAAPDKYSAAWLEQRIARIEMIAGPLPSPMPPTVEQPPKRRFWKRR